MKYLNNYVEKAQTKLFDKTGTFFAFGIDQFKDGITKKVKPLGLSKPIKITDCGAGMFTPSINYKELANGLRDINKAGIKQDIKENGIKAIIHRELANHECQISMDITDAVEKLEDYGITRKQIKEQWKDYFNNCVKNDLF